MTKEEHRYRTDDGLADLLDRCGHYFTHRIGGSRRGQGNVMAWLARNPDVTQKELAEQLGVMPASLSEVLMKLERKGFIEREKDENDRRMVRVRLTGEGSKALEQPDGMLAEPFRALTQEERETLARLLGKLLADWEERCVPEQKKQGGRPCGGHSGHEKNDGGERGGGPDDGRRGHGRR